MRALTEAEISDQLFWLRNQLRSMSCIELSGSPEAEIDEMKRLVELRAQVSSPSVLMRAAAARLVVAAARYDALGAAA